MKYDEMKKKYFITLDIERDEIVKLLASACIEVNEENIEIAAKMFRAMALLSKDELLMNASEIDILELYEQCKT